MSRDHCDVGGHTAFHQRMVLESAHQQHRIQDSLASLEPHVRVSLLAQVAHD